MNPLAPTLGMAALAGLALGSYAVTAGLRFARSEPSVAGRSHCDSCGQTLSFAQTVPVIAYVRARGACVACRARIDPIHLVGELGGLAVAAAAVLVHDWLRTPLLCLLGLALVATATIDWKIGRLPDALTGAIAVIALLLAAAKSVAALEVGLISAAVAFLVLQGLRLLAARLRRDPGLGLGDVKLTCALALWLGVATPWMIAGAAFAGLAMMWAVRPVGGRLAFGPALAAAAWVVGIGGEWGAWPTTM
jgi:leader peptidase (prepilin peptidase) / N-methyltransferase